MTPTPNRDLPTGDRTVSDHIECRNCGNGGWVCENHGDRPWEGTSLTDEHCECGGAGKPCGVCNLQMASSPYVYTNEAKIATWMLGLDAKLSPRDVAVLIMQGAHWPSKNGGAV